MDYKETFRHQHQQAFIELAKNQPDLAEFVADALWGATALSFHEGEKQANPIRDKHAFDFFSVVANMRRIKKRVDKMGEVIPATEQVYPQQIGRAQRQTAEVQRAAAKQSIRDVIDYVRGTRTGA